MADKTWFPPRGTINVSPLQITDMLFSSHRSAMMALVMMASGTATLSQAQIVPLASTSSSIIVVDKDSKEPLPGAVVRLSDGQTRYANFLGRIEMSQGASIAKVSMLGYESHSDVKAGDTLFLKALSKQTKDVIIEGINAADKSGYAFTNMKRSELAKQNFGQDLPFLLNFTPSVVVTSDAGAGVGYTGIRIRGSDASRVNITLNGVPVNDAESQQLFWVNMPDLASSISGLQVQRGVGTSTNGAAAFGGSVNIQTEGLNEKPYVEINNSGGSFNTLRNTVRVGTGLLSNKIAVDARLSRIASDGYIDRASSDLKSFYTSLRYQSGGTRIKAMIMSGRERTYQAWNGVPKDVYNAGNRTFNSFTYPNQTDNYQQDHYQLHLNQDLTRGWELGVSTFMTYGRGYYEEAQYTSDMFADTKLSNYGINPISLKAGSVLPTGDTVRQDTSITNSDIIRRKWLDNKFYGGVFTLTKKADRYTLTIGGGANRYEGQHFGEIVWARYMGQRQINDRYYSNKAFKNDYNLYVKLTYDLTRQLSAFIDLQGRRIEYQFQGLNALGQPTPSSVQLNMPNPKGGIHYRLSDKMSVFGSVAVAHREPNRNDYVNSRPDNRPEKEQLVDYEAGAKGELSWLKWGVQLYHMEYSNQLVLTGRVDETGEFVRSNVGNSYRQGIEVESQIRVLKNLLWAANLTWSRNRVRSFTDFVSGYEGPNDYLRLTYSNTPIAFSPSVIAGSQLLYKPIPEAEIGLLTKYVGRQYLDNTGDKERSLAAYYTHDLRVSYQFGFRNGTQLSLGVLVNNLGNALYVRNGYAFRDKNPDNSINSYVFYYPQATRNFLLMTTLKF